MKKPAPKASLVEVLTQKKLSAQKRFANKQSFAKAWFEKNNLSLDDIRAHSQKLLAGAALGGTLLLTSPALHLPQTVQTSFAVKLHQTISEFLARVNGLGKNKLSLETEDEIIQNIKKMYGVSASFELDKNRLPDSIGLMGLEQHLYRFSGDTLSQHSAFQEEGIAPARGAFGYFTEEGKSKEQMENEERYYIVLQTFLIPNWNSDWVTLKDWYKFRKFLVVNLENGKAAVAVLGDSGPGVSTGKKFGGSPEMMATLGWYPRQTKGKVLVVFLDDPANTIPLGPVAPLVN